MCRFSKFNTGALAFTYNSKYFLKSIRKKLIMCIKPLPLLMKIFIFSVFVTVNSKISVAKNHLKQIEVIPIQNSMLFNFFSSYWRQRHKLLRTKVQRKTQTNFRYSCRKLLLVADFEAEFSVNGQYLRCGYDEV